jgi:putative Mg2+ transporter-C (MgtC) family protein
MDLRADDFEMILRLIAALVAGAFIGYERSFHGRPAGLRTHVLVCLASSLLMLVTVYEDHWVRMTGDSRLDPTRMAQGIMTGIGFLGAGVIVKEGLNVRGLTTAASIWITAAIGVLAGVGLYLPLAVSVVLTLAVLSGFRWIERRVPTQAYYYFEIRYSREGNLSEEAMRALLNKLGFSIANFSYRLDGASADRVLRHSMTLQTTDRGAAPRLARWLEENTTVHEFRLSPSGD